MSGLTDSGLVLSGMFALSGVPSAYMQTVSLAANASSFSFTGKIASGWNYTVGVQTQPVGQTCTVSNGSGSMAAANVNTVQVTCVTTPVSGNGYSKVGSYPITDCVKDTATGLIWEGHPTSGFRASSNLHTNYDSTIYGTQSQIDAATNSIGYKNAVNASALCGYTNWRLPTETELEGLVLTGVGSPTIDTTWFPNTGTWYWTSTPDPYSAVYARYVQFYDGSTGINARYHDAHLRLVRSATNPVVVNGVCGTANTVAVLTKPSVNLCSSGTAGTVTGSGPSAAVPVAALRWPPRPPTPWAAASAG